jgi:hypothetical protein
MSTPPPFPSAAERFAMMFRWLIPAISAMSGGGRLSHFLIGLLSQRLILIRQRVAEIFERIEAGTYQPRQPAAKSGEATAPARRPPPPKTPLPNSFGWLLPIVPYCAAGSANQYLHQLFEDAEMRALLAAAPTALRRPLRSLCWMLGVKPPPILANPREPHPPKPPAAPAGDGWNGGWPPGSLSARRPSASWPKGVTQKIKPLPVRKNPA